MHAERVNAGTGLLVTYTIFPDVWPKNRTERADVPWHDLCAKIHDAPTYISKRHCPLISMAAYGEQLSDKGIIRHADNVQRVYGIEIDYDGEEVQPEEGANRLRGAGLLSIIYTSPSHVEGAPRWRALLPLSEPAAPSQRMIYVARANRALGGIATRESFTLSQSFYIGRVRGANYRVIETEGRCVDLAADLEPLYFTGHTDGASPKDTRTDGDLRDAFQRGEDRYQAMMKLSARWAARGMAADDIISALHGLLGDGPGTLNGDGIDLRTRVEPLARSAVQKFGESRRRYESPAFDHEPPPTEIPPVESYDDAEAIEPDSGSVEIHADEPAAEVPISAPNWSPKDPQAIPPREWLYGYHYMRGMISLTAGAGGGGKSSNALVEIVSMCLGIDLLRGGAEIPVGPLTVWYHNGEDPMDELDRRLGAICLHYRIDPAQVARRLRITSGRTTRLILAREIQGTVLQVPETKEGVIREIRNERIDVLVTDPFISTHQVAENSNPAMEQVMWQYRAIAEESNAAIETIHHFRKGNGQEVSADDIRGATAIIGASRSVRVIAPMEAREAELYGIPEVERRRYVWMMNPKANMRPPSDRKQWREMVSVDLGNARDPFPSDSVGVAAAWEPTPPSQLMRYETKCAVLRDMREIQARDRLRLRADSRSKMWAGNLIAERLGIDVRDKHGRSEVGRILDGMVKDGTLRRVAAADPAEGRTVPILEVVEEADRQ